MHLNHLCTAIRNGYRNKKSNIIIKSYSKTCFDVLTILKREGFIRGYAFDYSRSSHIYVFLKYSTGNQPLIKSIYNISTNGRKFYTSAFLLRKLSTPSNTLILSTTKGYLTDFEAIAENVGGFLVCKVIS